MNSEQDRRRKERGFVSICTWAWVLRLVTTFGLNGNPPFK